MEAVPQATGKEAARVPQQQTEWNRFKDALTVVMNVPPAEVAEIVKRSKKALPKEKAK